MKEAFPLAWRTFHMPKAGHTLAEYEDAFHGDPKRGRFAIADGATESAFAAAWAQILVKAYVEKAPGRRSGWLAAARKKWFVPIKRRELPWYAEIKFEEGAYAAMLGIQFKGSRWRAICVGDCCLFQVRDHRLLRVGPLENSGEFGNRPMLLGSRGRLADQPRTQSIKLRGEVHAADLFLLMTDALAEWFMKAHEAGRQPWIELQAMATEDQFTQFITNARETKNLRNDDVTLMMLQFRNL